MIKRYLETFFGGPLFQPMWESLHKLSLHRMNFGRGATLKKSGEKWVLNYLANIMSKKTSVVVFDVGAHIGDYASAVILQFGEKADLYCYEPSKSTFELLTDRLKNHTNVKLFNFGFGEKEEHVPLYSSKEESSISSVYKRSLHHCGVTMEYAEEVELRTLDNFCAEKGIKHIDFLKLDVEGHELRVLSGASNLISSNSIDFIQFEFGDCNIDSRTYFRDFFFLLNPYYRINRILKKGLTTIEKYNEKYEIFKVTNYLAISRKI
jgi:FkbM family methyltransferase